MDEDGNSLPDRLEDVLKVSGIGRLTFMSAVLQRYTTLGLA